MRTFFLISALLLSGCIQINAQFVPPSGVLYTSVKAPLTVRFNNTPVTDKRVTENKEFMQVPVKLGGGMMPSIGFDDESGDNVFSDQRLSEVDYADYEYMSVLGIYARTRINYYGK
jgi:hypothetical protein